MVRSHGTAKIRMLAARLQTGCLEGKIALGDVFRQPPEDAAEDALQLEQEGGPASCIFGFHRVAGYHSNPGSHANPREASSWFDRRDLPYRRWKLRLPDHRTASNRERPPAEALDGGDRRGPFVPAVDIAHHLPHALRRGGDRDRNAELSHGRHQGRYGFTGRT